MKTLKLRILDKHVPKLGQVASACNYVWNYVNALGFTHLQRTGKFFGAYDIAPYTKGAGELLGLHSQTIQAITETYVKSRKQFRKAKLKWRTNRHDSKHKALGWIPFKKSAVKVLPSRQTGRKKRKTGIVLSLAKGCKLHIEVWDSYNLDLYQANTCELVQDSRGRWYACITVKDFPKTKCGTNKVGIDLGFKTAATTSNGEQLITKVTQAYAKALGTAQRAGNKARVKAINAKIRHTRQDLIHKFTTNLVKDSAVIVVGDVKSTAIIQPRKRDKPTNQQTTPRPHRKRMKLAKSVYDAGWFELKRQLEYKCKHAGCQLEIVSEHMTTQTCSRCGNTTGSPKGRTGLGIREWTCGTCHTTHDRDINAARNILAVGLHRLEVGIPSL